MLKMKRKELKEFIFNEMRGQFPELAHIDNHELDLKIFQAPSTIRLRPFGLVMLKQMYDCYEFELGERLSGRELLALKNHVGTPYFLPTNQKRIFIFSSKSAFVLNLKGGDVKNWLRGIINKNSVS